MPLIKFKKVSYRNKCEDAVAVAVAVAVAKNPVRRGKQAGANPAGAAHKDVRRFRRRRMRLTEIPRPACEPHGFIVGRGVRAAFFWLLFFAVQRKVTRAQRETLLLQTKQGKDQSKIKSTPPQSSPALRAREEAKAKKQKTTAKSKWIPAFAGMTAERFRRSLGYWH